MKKVFMICLVLFMSLSMFSCKKKNKNNQSMSLQDSTIELTVGDTYTINPTIENAKDSSISITTDNQDIVEIKGNVVTAKKAGTVNLTITLNENSDISKTLKVTVKEQAVVTYFDIGGDRNINVGDTFNIIVSTNLSGTTTFESSNPAVLTVNSEGVVTAASAGSAVITARNGDSSATLNVNVIETVQKEIKLSGAESIYVLKSSTLKYELVGLEGKPTFISSDTSIATVNAAGTVKAISPGKVTITATLDGVSATIDIMILAQPVVTFTNLPENMIVGQSIKVEYTVEHTTEPVVLSVTDTTLAEISSEGVLTIKAPGRIKVQAQVDTFKFTATINVAAPEVTITNKTEKLYLDEPYQILYTVSNTSEIPTFSVSNESIATITEGGIVTPTALGKITITISIGKYTDSFDATIVPPPVLVTYNFNGGYSEETLMAGKTTEPTLELNNYNYSNGTFWGGLYKTDIFIGDKDHDPVATFSDRIYIGKNKETNLYEVVGIIRSGSSSWQAGAEYVISISNSYSTNGKSYNLTIKPITANIEVGQMVAFDKDFKLATNTEIVKVSFFSKVPKVDSIEVQLDESSELITPGYLGYKFLGWYDSNETKVESLAGLTKSIVLNAKWEELNPVTDINVTSITDEIVDGETFQVVANVVPTDAYFTTLYYETSNPDIFTVSNTGLITAVNVGTATLTIHDYLNKVQYVKEITVYPVQSIDITFNEVYVGYLGIDEEITIIPKAYGKGLDSATFNFESSNPSVAAVDASGKITALSTGAATITISIPDTSINLTVLINVSTYSAGANIDNLVKLLAEANFGHVEMGNVSLYNDGSQRYYVPVYGSVNRFLFDDFYVHEDYYQTSRNNPNNHKSRRSTDQIEFVCVHDTATLTGTVVSIASGMASGETSIHYTVGNDAIYGVVPEEFIAYHAGDGTGTAFTWTPSGVMATDTKTNPKYDMIKDSGKWYLTINGTKSNIVLPTDSISSPSAKYLTHLGPTWKVVDGQYYIGSTWWSKDYASIASRGGNNNSIGIEMNVNTSSDIYDTWQRTAQLVVDILIRNGLDTTRVKMHNTFSGKNCPQCIISAGNWDTFMEFVDLRYEIMTKYPTAKISIKSNNPDIVDDTGRVYNPPKITQTVSYDLTVVLGSETRTITLYNVVSGTTTWEQWEGRYPASRIWNNGHFSLV